MPFLKRTALIPSCYSFSHKIISASEIFPGKNCNLANQEQKISLSLATSTATKPLDSSLSSDYHRALL